MAIQGSNYDSHGPQRQAVSVVQQRQAVPNTQGRRQYVANPAFIARNQQGQVGSVGNAPFNPVPNAAGQGSGTAAQNPAPTASPYPHLPPSHGIPGRPPRTLPGSQPIWRVDGQP
jgi:hypothetical protein